LSVKWRRSKKRSGWFNTLRTSNRVKDRNTPQAFRLKNSRAKRQICPYRYRAPRIHRERKWREPRPLIDILEDKSEIIVITEFAGFKRENLKIHIKNQRLTLSAENPDRKYYKSLNLPKRVIPNTMRTTYKNGVLEIRLEKGIGEKAIDQVAG
jgi:HSP20 family molecular chaperone IbpA